MSDTTNRELIELAARCEQASGPDRELDAAIMFDLFAKPVGKHKADGGPMAYLWPEDNASWSFGHRFPGKDREWFAKARLTASDCSECGASNERETLLIERDGAFVLMNELRVPKLTASLDAAMTLVPDGWFVHDLTEYNQRTWQATLRGPDELRFERGADAWASSRTKGNENGVATPALALCAASLKARASGEQ